MIMKSNILMTTNNQNPKIIHLRFFIAIRNQINILRMRSFGNRFQPRNKICDIGQVLHMIMKTPIQLLQCPFEFFPLFLNSHVIPKVNRVSKNDLYTVMRPRHQVMNHWISRNNISHSVFDIDGKVDENPLHDTDFIKKSSHNLIGRLTAHL